MRQVLRHAGFRRLWAGQAISLVGDGIYFVAIAWAALSLGHGGEGLSLIVASWALANVVTLPYAGVLGDRHDRRGMLLLADAIRVVALLGLGLATVNDTGGVPLLCAFAALQGVGDALFLPSFVGTVAGLVPDEDLVRANALEQVIRPVAYRVLGPALGGVLVALGSPGVALLVDAGTFAVCFVVMLGLPRLPAAGASQEPSRWRDGLAYIRTQRWLAVTLACSVVINIVFWASIEVLVPTLLHDRLDGSAGDYGALLVAQGVGGLLGGWLLSRAFDDDAHHPLKVAFGAWMLVGAAISAYGLAGDAWQMWPVALVFAVGMAVGGALWTTTLQRRVADGMLARVSAVDLALSNVLTPAAVLIAGPLAATGRPDTALLVGGAVVVALLAAGWAAGATDT